MKKLWLFWWLANIFWLIIFTIGTVFIWIREFDGAGVIQTSDAKLAAFIVLLIAFLFPFAIQFVWLIINLVIKNNKRNKLEQV